MKPNRQEQLAEAGRHRWDKFPTCACGCGKRAAASPYHVDCANACKCGCGKRCRYAYCPGHRPEAVCVRCGKIFTGLGGDTEHCNNCRRALKRGGPEVRDQTLAGQRKMQKEAPEGRRWCCGCEQYRLLKFFGKSAERYYSRCRPCHRDQIRATKWLSHYGITPEQYEGIKDLQGGKCAICQVATGASKALSVDHDHKHCDGPKGCIDCVRGLLCSNCNYMLGLARDNPEFFRRAMEYLQIPPAKAVLKRITIEETQEDARE
jgi:hypothetical protein